MASAPAAVVESLPGSDGIRTSPQRFSIHRVAVLGAGTMGARIAAHVANAGLPVLLLDIVPSSGDRNALGSGALLKLKAARPAAFASAAAAKLISLGNFEDDLPQLANCDWVIEAVAENLEIKRNLLEKVAPHLHAEAIFTSNTSGLPIAKVGEQLPAALRKRWFGTHFFNPPRHMRLLELIATPEADPEAVAAVASFADRQLGKSVVPANDVPNFIANRIGTFSLLNVMKVMEEQDLTIEEVDLLTGAVIGWPKTGTFRLADMVGLDVIGSIVRNFEAAGGDERPDVRLPEFAHQLLERQWLGDKTGQGFYKKERGADGKEVRSVLDWHTLEYKPAGVVALPALERIKGTPSLPARLKALLAGDPATDKAARFYLKVLPELWAYAANRIGEVAETPAEIDQAMRTGFNWELGPFAMWDAAGVRETVERMRALGFPVPAAVEALLRSGGESWFRKDGAECFDIGSGTYKSVAHSPELASIASYRRSNGVVAGNADMSLIDLGDGVACFELHSKMNALGADTVSFLTEQLRAESASVRNFQGFVIATDAQNFSAGANLAQLLQMVQTGAWDQVRSMIEQFQAMTQAIKFCSRPVVAAASGLCLGGGCEVALHAAFRQAHLELYTGLVEAGVGLIPGGGGCKEMMLRAVAKSMDIRPDSRGDSPEIVETLRQAFETIAMAKVSTSAANARELDLLEDTDAISMNRGRLLHDARMQAMRLGAASFLAPLPRTDIPAPGRSVFATLKLTVYLMREAQYISEHDGRIATHLARILTGGDINPGTPLTEQHLLDLEREAFLSLCGEPKTAERIEAMLKTGKPLRN